MQAERASWVSTLLVLWRWFAKDAAPLMRDEQVSSPLQASLVQQYKY